MPSALVVGSMAPDFRYFLNLASEGHFGHTVKGAFFFCLPAGLAVLWIFHAIIKFPMLSLVPQRHQERLVGPAERFRWGPAGHFALILLSLLVGTFSHLAWDACTHDHGFVVRNIPELRSHALEEFGSQRPLYNVLQHGSTVVGMAFLFFWYWRWFKRSSPRPVPPSLQTAPVLKVWIAGTILLLAGGSSVVYAYFDSDHIASLGMFAGIAAVTFMSLVFIEALVFGLWWQWRARGSRQKAISTQHSALSPETVSSNQSEKA